MVDVADMTGKTVVITGGTSGIGLETAAALAGAGARVVITGRDPARTQRAVDELSGRVPDGKVESAVFDLVSLDSVRKGADDILARLTAIDVLINNAGLVLSSRQQTPDGFEATLAINHLGPFLFTRLLLDRIKESAPARIINVASTAHKGARNGIDFDDLHTTRRYSGMRAYSRSKLANILFTRELASRLAGTGVTVNSLHPGTVASGFAGDGDANGWFAFGVRIIRPFILSSEQGAKTSVYLASSPEIKDVTGAYFVRCRPVTPSKAARDDEAARRLWDVSEQMVGLSEADQAA